MVKLIEEKEIIISNRMLEINQLKDNLGFYL